MVGLIVDWGYEILSSTLSANSVYTISKMALLFAKTKVKNSVFQPAENLYFENVFQGPAMVGRIVETQFKIMYRTLKVFSTHACPPAPPLLSVSSQIILL